MTTEPPVTMCCTHCHNEGFEFDNELLPSPVWRGVLDDDEVEVSYGGDMWRSFRWRGVTGFTQAYRDAIDVIEMGWPTAGARAVQGRAGLVEDVVPVTSATHAHARVVPAVATDELVDGGPHVGRPVSGPAMGFLATVVGVLVDGGPQVLDGVDVVATQRPGGHRSELFGHLEVAALVPLEGLLEDLELLPEQLDLGGRVGLGEGVGHTDQGRTCVRAVARGTAVELFNDVQPLARLVPFKGVQDSSKTSDPEAA